MEFLSHGGGMPLLLRSGFFLPSEDLVLVELFEPLLETILEVPHTSEHNEREECRKNGDGVHTEADCHAHSRDYPETGGRRDAVYGISAENDDACAKETDAGNDARRKAHRIKIYDAEVGAVDVRGHDDEEARAERDEAEGARARRLFREDSALGPDDAAKKHPEKKICE